MKDEGETWYDDDAGPLVRPYTVTGGRTESASYELDLITLVVAVHTHIGAGAPEYARVLRACELPVSVAEVAAAVDLPLGVVKILISDLIERNYVVFRSSMRPSPSGPSLDLMQKVLDGIRKL